MRSVTARLGPPSASGTPARGIPPVARPRGACGLPFLLHWALSHFRHDGFSRLLILLFDVRDSQPEECIDHRLLTPRGPILDPVEEIQAQMHRHDLHLGIAVFLAPACDQHHRTRRLRRIRLTMKGRLSLSDELRLGFFLQPAQPEFVRHAPSPPDTAMRSPHWLWFRASGVARIPSHFLPWRRRIGMRHGHAVWWRISEALGALSE